MPDEAYDSTGVLDESCKTGMMATNFEDWFECLDGTHRTEACEYPLHSCAVPQLTALHRFTSPPRGLRSHCVDPQFGPDASVCIEYHHCVGSIARARSLSQVW